MKGWTPEARAAQAERTRKQFESTEARAAASERGRKAMESAEARAALAEKGRAGSKIRWAKNREMTTNRTEPFALDGHGDPQLIDTGARAHRT
jgi:hypothetical protein